MDCRLEVHTGGSRGAVLLTGATGFVGARLANELLRLGYEVHAIARDQKKLHSLLGTECTNRVKVLTGDLLHAADLEVLRQQLLSVPGRFEAVIHAVGGGPLTSNRSLAQGIFDLNLETTRNLVEILQSSEKLGPLPVFVYYSSLAAMGLPNRNGDRIVYSESTTCNPVLPYEQAKFQTEVFLKERTLKQSFKTVILRFPQIYGGADDALLQMVGMIRKGVFPVIRGRSGTLPLIHVDDAVRATCAIIQNPDKVPESYCVYLVSEESRSYDQLVEVVRRKYGRAGTLRVPYGVLYLGTSLVERIFALTGKPEPLNRRRVASLASNRVVDCRKFLANFEFSFEQNVESFIENQQS